jgi:hypothetical protein
MRLWFSESARVLHQKSYQKQIQKSEELRTPNFVGKAKKSTLAAYIPDCDI